jgi:hypothetical protein
MYNLFYFKLNILKSLLILDLKNYFCKMKLIAISILLLFITFLSIPTLVIILEKKANVSICFGSAEEEFQKDVKEIKADLNLNFNYKLNLIVIRNKSKIFSENLSKHDNVSEEIFSPPPEIA